MKFGMSGLALTHADGGAILLLMGVTGLGAAVKFIPRMVVLGFTNGIAVLIASTQIKDFFGLKTGAVPSEFLPRMKVLAAHFSSLNWYAVALGAGTVAVIVLLPRLNRRIPGSIVALLVFTAASAIFHLPWKQLERALAAFRRAFRRLLCRTCMPSTFCL